MFDQEENVEEVHVLDFEEEHARQSELIEKTLELNNVEDIITGEQGVNKDIAIDLENIAHGMAKLSRSVKSYTESFSATNYKVTLEDMSNMHKGVKIALWGVMIAIVGKIIHFIYKGWKGAKEGGNSAVKGERSAKVEAVRDRLQHKHIDRTHHMFSVHTGLVDFVNQKMTKLPKPFTVSNVKEVFEAQWAKIYGQRLGNKMCVFTKGLADKDGPIHSMIGVIITELNHRADVIKTSFETVKKADTDNDQHFKAASLEFKFQALTSLLTNLKVSFDDKDNKPIRALQKHANAITAIKPDLAVPNIASLNSMDTTKIGKELTTFNHDEFTKKLAKFQDEVSDFKTHSEGQEGEKNQEVIEGIRLINHQAMEAGVLSSVLKKLIDAFDTFVNLKTTAGRETIQFDLSVLNNIAKAKDILTAVEIKIIKDLVSETEKSLNDALNTH